MKQVGLGNAKPKLSAIRILVYLYFVSIVIFYEKVVPRIPSINPALFNAVLCRQLQ
jgi:hypothetical protein